MTLDLHLVSGVGDVSVPDVDQHVLPELTGLHEAPGAQDAGMRFVGHVGLPVCRQAAAGGERLPAVRAAVKLLRRMEL